MQDRKYWVICMETILRSATNAKCASHSSGHANKTRSIFRSVALLSAITIGSVLVAGSLNGQSPNGSVDKQDQSSTGRLLRRSPDLQTEKAAIAERLQNLRLIGGNLSSAQIEELVKQLDSIEIMKVLGTEVDIWRVQQLFEETKTVLGRKNTDNAVEKIDEASELLAKNPQLRYKDRIISVLKLLEEAKILLQNKSAGGAAAKIYEASELMEDVYYPRASPIPVDHPKRPTGDEKTPENCYKYLNQLIEQWKHDALIMETLPYLYK